MTAANRREKGALNRNISSGHRSRLWRSSEPLEDAHAAVRGVAAAWDQDRFMAPDIAAVAGLVDAGRFTGRVQSHGG